MCRSETSPRRVDVLDSIPGLKMSSQTHSNYEHLHRSSPDLAGLAGLAGLGGLGGMLVKHNSKLPPANSASCADPGTLPVQSNTQYHWQQNRQLGMANGAIPSPASASYKSPSYKTLQYMAPTLPLTPDLSPECRPPPAPQPATYMSGIVGQHSSMSPMPYCPRQSASTGFVPPYSFDSLESQNDPYLLDFSMSSRQIQFPPYNPYEKPGYPSYPIDQSNHGFKAPQMYQSQPLQLGNLLSDFDPGIFSITPPTSENQPSTEMHRTQRYPLFGTSADSGYRSDDASDSPSPTVPGVVAITPPDAAQASCPTSEIQNSNRIMASAAPPTQKIRTFPRLGFNTTNDDESYINQATPENRQSPGRDLCITATNVDSSPTRSDLSSSGWTDDGQDAETLRLISVSSNVLVSAYMKLATNYISKECQNGATGDSPPCKAPRNQTQQTQNSSNGRKRKLNYSDSGSDDFDDNGYPKRRKTGSTHSAQASSDILPLACPFNKYDSILFGPDSPEEAYHACATCSFVNIAYLKQHLQRNHYMPKYYCYRCCRRFTSQAMAASHMRQHPPCETLDPPLYRERIGPDMIEDLGLDRKNLPGTDRVEYWYRLYNAFFPGAADRRPLSPYYEGPAAQHMGRFLRFSRPAIRDLLPEVQQRLGLEGALQGHNLVRLMEEILQDATQRYLQQLTGLGAFQIGQADSFTTIGSIVASQPDTAIPNGDANNEAAQPTLTPPLGTQESLRGSSPPSTLSASTTSGSTVESPTIPRTPLSAVTPSRTLERLSVAGGPLNQDLPMKSADNGEDLFPFDASIAYSPGFNWAAEIDSVEGFDWNVFCPEVSASREA